MPKGFTKRKDVQEAIAKARELEQEPEPIASPEEAEKIYEEGIALAERLKKTLGRAWYQHETKHAKHACWTPVRKKKGKAGKTVAKRTGAKKASARKQASRRRKRSSR